MMDKYKKRALVDGLLIFFSLVMAVVFFRAAWSGCVRLGYVRFVALLPVSGWVKMLLWGWA